MSKLIAQNMQNFLNINKSLYSKTKIGSVQQIAPYQNNSISFQVNYSKDGSYNVTENVMLTLSKGQLSDKQSYNPRYSDAGYFKGNKKFNIKFPDGAYNVTYPTTVLYTPNTAYTIKGTWYNYNQTSPADIIPPATSIPITVYTSPNSVTAQFQSATEKATYFNFPSVDCSSFTVQSSLGTSQFPYSTGIVSASITGIPGIYPTTVSAYSALSGFYGQATSLTGYILGYNFNPAPNITSIASISAATLSWNYTYPQLVDSMSITYYPKDGGTTLTNSYNSSQLITTLSSLIPSTSYTMNAQTFFRSSNINFSSSINTFTFSTLKGININTPSITLQSFNEAQQSTNSLNLIWDKTLIPLVSNYSISYNIVGETPITKTSLGGAFSKTTIQSLEPGTPYQVQGQTFYTASGVLFSSSVYNTTFTTLPPQMDFFLFIAQSYTLDMGFTQIMDLPNTSFYQAFVTSSELSVMPQTLSNTIPLEENSTIFQVPHADTEYRLSIQACVKNKDLSNVTYSNCGALFTTLQRTIPIGPDPVMDPLQISLIGIDNSQPVSSVSMRLAWADGVRENSDSYSITYRAQAAPNPNIKIGLRATDLTINNLMPATAYTISGQRFFYQDPHMFSSTAFETTYVTTPDGMTDLYQIDASLDSMEFSYTRLNAISNPELAGYQLTLLTNSNVYKTFSLGKNTYSYLATDTYPGIYQAQVQAYVENTDLGGNVFYNYGAAFTVQASTDVVLLAPSITLYSFEDEQMSTASLHLYWNQVAFADFLSITIQPFAGGDKIACPVNIQDSTFLKAELQPATKYLIRGQSFKRNLTLLRSSAVYSAAFTTLPPQMPDINPVAATKNSLQLSFTPLDRNAAPDLEGYKVQLVSLFETDIQELRSEQRIGPRTAKSRFGSRLKTQPILSAPKVYTILTQDTNVTFQPIPNGSYIPKVSAYVQNTNLDGEFVTSAGLPFVPTTPALETVPDLRPPPLTLDFTQEHESANVLSLVWDPAVAPFSAPIFSLTYALDTDNALISPLALDPTDVSLGTYSLDGLLPATKYKLSAQTFYTQDSVLYSSTIFRNKLTTTPEQMSALVQLSSASHNVTVGFEPLSAISNPATELYQIVTTDDAGMLQSTTVDKLARTAIIRNLQPNSQYASSIRACVYNYDLTNKRYTQCGDEAMIGTILKTAEPGVGGVEADGSNSSRGLSDGAIIGIIIGVIVFLWLLFRYNNF